MGSGSQVDTQPGHYFLPDSKHQQGMGDSLPLLCYLSATDRFLVDTSKGLPYLLDNSDQLGTPYHQSKKDLLRHNSSLHRIVYIHTCKHDLLACCKFLLDTCTRILGR